MNEPREFIQGGDLRKTFWSSNFQNLHGPIKIAQIVGEHVTKNNFLFLNPKKIIWNPLPFRDMIREVPKGWENLVLQKGGLHYPCGTHFATGPNFDMSKSPPNRVPNYGT